MCKYIETFHEFNGCRLKETLNGQPTRFAAFVKGVTNLVRGQENEDDGAKGESHAEGGLGHHQIKQRNIWQCPKAINDPSQKGKPEDKRVCADPKYWEGEDALEQIETLGITVHRATCPVCTAVEEVIRERSNQTVPVERGHKTTNSQRRHGTVHVKGSGTRKKPIVHGPPPQPALVRTPINKHNKKKQGCRLM